VAGDLAHDPTTGWTARLALPSAGTYLFEHHGDRSGWTVEGGTIASVGFDVLVADGTDVVLGIPAVPGGTSLLVYGDGRSLLWSGSLALATVDDLEAAEALNGSFRGWRGTQLPLTVEGPDGTSVRVELGSGPYVPSEGSPWTSTLDASLPPWVVELFEARWPVVDGALAERFGPTEAAVTHLGWAGESEAWANDGFAQPPVIGMMTTTSTDPAQQEAHRNALTWFFAHERVHHHQLGRGVSVRGWPLEGGADTLATAVLWEEGFLDDAALQARYAGVRRDCARELARGPVRRAPGRVQYVCGDLLQLAIWKATGDLVGFWGQTLDMAAAQGASVDGDFTQYVLAGMVDADTAAAFVAFETERHDDPDAAIQALLEAVDLVRDDGTLVLPYATP